MHRRSPGVKRRCLATRWPAAARLKRGSRAKRRAPSPDGEGPCHSRKARALEDRALLERSKKLSCSGARASVLTLEYTGSLPTSEVKRRRARLVLGWGTAREDLRVLSAFCFKISPSRFPWVARLKKPPGFLLSLLLPLRGPFLGPAVSQKTS